MYKFFLFCLSLLFFTSLAHPALAVDLQKQINDQITAGANGAALQAPTDPQIIITDVIKILLQIIGMFFMILVILGGWKYINAKGDESQVDEGKETIKGAIIGLIIVMLAYSITLFVSTKFTAAVNQGGTVDQNYNPSVKGR